MLSSVFFRRYVVDMGEKNQKKNLDRRTMKFELVV